MQVVQAPRASAILYSLLGAIQEKRPWLLPANICSIVPITFLKAGVPFQFVDISSRTLHMDLDQVQALVKTHTFGGILYVHTYGDASTPNDFFVAIKDISPELMIVDDRCLCLPNMEIDSTNKADLELYSTGYAKIVELNFGGYAFIHDEVPYEPAHLPFDPKHHEEIEQAYKQAIRERVKFVYQDSDWLETDTPVPSWDDYCGQIQKNLTGSLEHRATLNHIYTSMLPMEIQLPTQFQPWRFNIRVKNKQQILEKIFAAGLFASSHYASLAGIMDDGKAPEAETLAESIINLFNDHHFTADQAEFVCKIILESLP
jgi:dTDP-4-amino-4,6-dideoxygalactose transaminase